MVQVHAARIGVPHRPTDDVDIVLHIETNAISYTTAQSRLEELEFTLSRPSDRDGFAHRFERGKDVVDVMVADHLKSQPRVMGYQVFKVPGSTGALPRTVNVTVHVGDEELRFSLPSVIAALGLKGAAYTADSRDSGATFVTPLSSPAASTTRRRWLSRCRAATAAASGSCGSSSRLRTIPPGC